MIKPKKYRAQVRYTFEGRKASWTRTLEGYSVHGLSSRVREWFYAEHVTGVSIDTIDLVEIASE